MGKAKKQGKLKRRTFIVRSLLGGTGLLMGTLYVARNPIRRKIANYLNTAEAPYIGNTDTPSIWFEVQADNTIIFNCPKVEMGQGIFTGLAQIAADELDVNMSQLRVVHAPTSTGNVDQFSTGGSTSISSLWIPLRELAATMREMIKIAAAKKMDVLPETLKMSKGTVIGKNKTMTYAKAIEGITQWEIPETPLLKEPKAYTNIGKAIPRIDLEAKVMGTPLFGMDATMPNMLYGAIVRPTHIGAIYIDADTSKAEKMPGVVKIVKEKDFVGVVATSQTAADTAKKAIDVVWDIPKIWQSSDIETTIKVGQGTPYIIQKEGDAKGVLEADETELIQAEYSSPIGAHAQLEPNGALAYVEADKTTIKTPTQVIAFTQKEVAERLSIATDKVEIIPTFVGGGFGRRLHTPYAMQAAVLSKAVGKPVKYFMDRQEEFQNDTFRPPTHHILKAKLDKNGLIHAIEHNVSSGDVMYGSPLVPAIAGHILGADLGAWRGGMIQYGKIPHYRALSWRVKLPFATSWWRSLGLLTNTFAIESFIDELAARTQKDPVQFRLDQIQDDTPGYRLKEVIKAAAAKAGYTNTVTNGRAMGFAASTDVSTPVAHVAEVSIENNQIKIHKVTCAIDPGMAINPDQIKAQCEGCIIMGISATMHEKMYVENGQLFPLIYGLYEMAMLKNAPKEIDVIILENGTAPGAVGEPPLGPIGAAIANAVYRLTGQRLRSMPLTLS